MSIAEAVIPILNEAPALPLLIEQLEPIVAGGLLASVWIVDDGSADETDRVLRQYEKSHSWLRLIRHSKNLGKSRALYSGLQNVSSRWVLFMDGDGQVAPNDIKKILETNRSGLSVVLGDRGGGRSDGLPRRVYSLVGNFLGSLFFGAHLADANSPLRLFRSEAVRRIPCFDDCHRFLPHLVAAAGGAVVSVPIRHLPRRHGVSHYGYVDRVWSNLRAMPQALGECRRFRGGASLLPSDEMI